MATTDPPPPPAPDPSKLPREGLKTALETTKQIITLSTGIATLTVTFAKEFKPAGVTALTVPWTLEVAWGLYGVAVVAGLVTLMAITGTMGNLDRGKGSVDPMAPNISIPALAIVFSFAAAFVFTLFAGSRLIASG